MEIHLIALQHIPIAETSQQHLHYLLNSAEPCLGKVTVMSKGLYFLVKKESKEL